MKYEIEKKIFFPSKNQGHQHFTFFKLFKKYLSNMLLLIYYKVVASSLTFMYVHRVPSMQHLDMNDFPFFV